MSETLIQYHLNEGVATLHLNDRKANALGYDMIAALRSSLKRAESEARVAVIMGMPGKFCAGFDLKVMQQSMSAAVELLKAGGALYVQMLRCSDAPMLRCSDAQMLRCSDAQMLICSYAHAHTGMVLIPTSQPSCRAVLRRLGCW